MKHIIATALALAPTLAAAHGGHAPVPDALHGAAHLALPAAALTIAVWLAVLALRRKDKS